MCYNKIKTELPMTDHSVYPSEFFESSKSISNSLYEKTITPIIRMCVDLTVTVIAFFILLGLLIYCCKYLKAQVKFHYFNQIYIFILRTCYLIHPIQKEDTKMIMIMITVNWLWLIDYDSLTMTHWLWLINYDSLTMIHFLI